MLFFSLIYLDLARYKNTPLSPYLYYIITYLECQHLSLIILELISRPQGQERRGNLFRQVIDQIYIT